MQLKMNAHLVKEPHNVRSILHHKLCKILQKECKAMCAPAAAIR
jgi:hypothetical protein